MKKTTGLFFAFAILISIATPAAAESAQEPCAKVLQQSQLLKRQIEHSAAGSLYLFSKYLGAPGKDLELFDILAPKDRYVQGYLYFKMADYPKAKEHFESAIREDSFVAPSRYMLAALIWRKHREDGSRGELGQALKHLDEAVSYDPEYWPAYYLRAALRWRDAQAKPALEDLEKAVAMSVASCHTLGNPQEFDSLWRGRNSAQEQAELERIQRECALKHGLTKGP